MTQDADIKLAAILDTYAVEDADPALLDRMVAHATVPRTTAWTPIVAFFFHTHVKRLALYAGLAVTGYWLGALSSATSDVTHYATALINLDHIFLGASSLNEVLL